MKKVSLALTIMLLFGCASQAPIKDIPLTQAEAKAEESKAMAAAMANAKDAETQRMLILAWALRGQNQAPAVVEQSSSLGAFALSVLDRAFGTVPAILAYKGQVRASQTTEAVAAINRDVSLGQFASTTQIAIAGINGSSAIGTALATRPVPTQPPTTQVTVSGGNVNVGSGSQANSSNNPVSNPNPVVCVVGANPPCAR